MYVPDEFATTDPALIRRLIRADVFATLVTTGKGATAQGATTQGTNTTEAPQVSHLPLLYTEGSPAILRGHIARANAQAADVEAGGTALAIFHGPHGYVSPAAYDHHPSVPTWNYAAVHVHGVLRPLGDDGLMTLLEDSVGTFEGDRTEAQRAQAGTWTLDLPEKYRTTMMSKILGFELVVSRVEAKVKLSQNKMVDDQRRVIDQFERGGPPGLELAALMRTVLGL